MAIRFVPNDPLAVGVVPPREQPPRPAPGGAQVDFSYAAQVAEDVYPLDSVEFRFWQCREAALATLETWGALAPLPSVWQNRQRLLLLNHDAGPGLAAHYNRTAVECFRSETDARKTYPAASTDAVAHEVGHALLDAVLPALWSASYPEAAAFHESFADCMALLVGFFDAPSRQALVQGGLLRAPNFLETLAEDVAEGTRLVRPNDPQALARQALNTLRWQMPANLPPAGLPGALTTEPHSFSRILTGCFYDTVCNIFAAQPNQGEQALLAAAQTAGRLLIAGVMKIKNEEARFFQAVGRAMLEADRDAGGANSAAIRDGFAAHDVNIQGTDTLAPAFGLSGPAPSVDTQAGTASLSPASRRDILERIGARGGRLTVTSHALGAETVAKATHRREISLSKLDRRLKGVVVPASESVYVGGSADRAVVLGQLPHAQATKDEVNQFVTTLIKHGALGLAAAKRAATGKPAQPEAQSLPTHTLQKRGGKTVLNRIRFTY